MKKHILLLMACCLQIAARGQTGYDYEYWFDNDRSTLQSGSSLSGSWQMDVDLNGLTENLHSFHFQVRDENGVLSSPVTRHFVKSVDRMASKAFYWFDDDISSKTTVQQVDGTFDIDVTSLDEGVHLLHYQVADRNGSVSATATRMFYKIYVPAKSRYHCWFDNDISTMSEGSHADESVILDVSQLSDGYHILHVQVDGGGKSYSVPVTRPFIKTPQLVGVDYLTCLCMIDDQLYQQEKVSSAGGVVEWNFDVSALPQGFHRMFVQVVTPGGAATAAYQGFFFREPTTTEFGEMKCVYCIDGSEFSQEAGLLTDGTFHFDLDVASLEDGLHRLTYMLSNGKGVSTKANVQFFMKTPLGGNGITQYVYWLNDNDTQMKEVRLSERQDPFSLITLLPVDEEPLRSSCFEFRIEDGQPVVYAKNDIHIRFYDASGRFTDVSKQFVDEHVKENVSNVTLLEPGKAKTVSKPAENAVAWFKVNAERGDSLAFKASQACTWQLYSPSGEELYRATGPTSVSYGGSYAPESGTYYIALHDVLGTYGNDITIDYQHVDKYAVLHYSPDTIGVSVSYIDMELDGNGYDKLEKVALRMNGSPTIWADSLNVFSKSSAKVRFTIRGEEQTGNYDLMLHFIEDGVTDSVVINNAVSLQEAKMGDVKVEIIHRNITQSPYPVTIKLTNTGNVGMLYVPFNIATTFNLAESIMYNQTSWASMRTINFDVLSSVNNAVEDSTKYSQPYSPYTVSYNLFGTGLPGMVLHGFIPRLGPHETKEFIVGFVGSSHAKFYLYAWAGIPLNAEYTDEDVDTNIYSVWKYLNVLETDSTSRKVRRKAYTNEGLDNALELADRLDRGNRVSSNARVYTANGLALGGLINGLRLNNNNAQTQNGEDWYAESVLEDYNDNLRQYMPSPGYIMDTAGVPNWLQGLLGLQRQQAECGTPLPKSEEIEIWNPGDPNDIYGYTAASGSRYVGNEIDNLHYTIEFENDSEIANASAHVISVSDTLDAKCFDLSTFEATSIRIGNAVMELDNVKSFTKKTMDLRPSIDVIAQISLDYDEQKGIARWLIESLDPMSMEQTWDAMQGVLPVNVNGNGIGELSFNIKRKRDLQQGELLNNRAGIIFDQNDVIMTPTWTNIVDAVAPVSSITDMQVISDTTAVVRISAEDDLSGVWRYDVYQQKGIDAEWQRVALNVPVDSAAVIRIVEGIDQGFYVVATDSAGNVEQKEAHREFSLTMSNRGDVNLDGDVDVADIVAVATYVLSNVSVADCPRFDVNDDGTVDVADIVSVANLILNGRQKGIASAKQQPEPQ